MTDQLHLVQAYHTPSSVFALYDYTKIIYPIDGYIAIREICTPGTTKPTFIKLEHEHNKIIDILAFPNLIVTVEELKQTTSKETTMVSPPSGLMPKHIMIGIYDNGVHTHVQLNSALIEEQRRQYIQQQKCKNSNNNSIAANQSSLNPKKDMIMGLVSKSLSQSGTDTVKIITKQSKKNVFVLIQSVSMIMQPQNTTAELPAEIQQQKDNQLIVFSMKSKNIIARAFLQGNFKEIFIKNDQQFTILHNNSSLFEYQLYEAEMVSSADFAGNRHVSNSKRTTGASPYTYCIMKKKEIFNSETKNTHSSGLNSISNSVDSNPDSDSVASSSIRSHIWMKQELIIIKESLQTQVYIEGKLVQTLPSFCNCLQILPMICGFMTMNDNFMRVYKKVEINYVCIAEFFIGEIGFSENICLSPQQDILMYYDDTRSSIKYTKEFAAQIQKSQAQIQQKQEQSHQTNYNSSNTVNIDDLVSRELKMQGQIQFININRKQQREYGSGSSSGAPTNQSNNKIGVHTARFNNTLVISQHSNLNLYSMHTFENYMKYSVESTVVVESNNNKKIGIGNLSNAADSPRSPRKKQSSRSSSIDQQSLFLSLRQPIHKSQTILTVALHPHLQLLAVALKSKVRIYQILYSQLQHIKDINVSNCSDMSYSNTGTFLNLIVSGKNGSKCYIYKTHQEYELYECLSIGKRIGQFIWSKYDTFVYGVHVNGFYRWSVGGDGFKSRFQLGTGLLKFDVVGAVLNFEKDRLLLYGRRNVLELTDGLLQGLGLGGIGGVGGSGNGNANSNGSESENNIGVSLSDKQLEGIIANTVIQTPTTKQIKQIIYQNGHYFVNTIITSGGLSPQSFTSAQEVIIKTVKLTNFWQVLNMMDRVSQANIYREKSPINSRFVMLPVKKNNLVLIEQTTLNVKVLEWHARGHASGNSAGNKISGSSLSQSTNFDLVRMERTKINNLFRKYQNYENHVKELQQSLHSTIQHMQSQLQRKQAKKKTQFISQVSSMVERYENLKGEKQKLQHSMQEKIYKHEQKTIKEVKQLQNMYQRKIAITTNKLLTVEQINFRNIIIAQRNLKQLQTRSNNDVDKIRQEYKTQLALYMNERDSVTQQLYSMKQQYESRLYDLQQQNQGLLLHYQEQTQSKVKALKQTLTSWQVKHSEVVSKKDNIEKSLEQQLQRSQALQYKITALEAKNREVNKKYEYLQLDLSKQQSLLIQKNLAVEMLEQRVNDLQKSNQIMKYRVIELKGQTEPQGQQNSKLKDNLNELQAEYDKIAKQAHEKQQTLAMYKKENHKVKEHLKRLELTNKKIEKAYLQLVDKVMNITKSPIQQIRKKLLQLLNCVKAKDTSADGDSSAISQLGARSNSPLGELNRIRLHLQGCLNQVVGSNKKGEKQKNFQVMKKNRENTQLIKEINELRRRVRELQSVVRQKELQISRVLRGEPLGNSAVQERLGQGHNRYQSGNYSQQTELGQPEASSEFMRNTVESKQEISLQGGPRQNRRQSYQINQPHFQTHTNFSSSNAKVPYSSNLKPALTHARKYTRENSNSHSNTHTDNAAFQKSLFKSSTYWKDKRLKTQQSQRRQSSYSRSAVKRNPSGKYLQIDRDQKGEQRERDRDYPYQQQRDYPYQQVDDLKRLLEQKETIIKQLINKIQALS